MRDAKHSELEARERVRANTRNHGVVTNLLLIQYANYKGAVLLVVVLCCEEYFFLKMCFTHEIESLVLPLFCATSRRTT
jgi:hypothetical protein